MPSRPPHDVKWWDSAVKCHNQRPGVDEVNTLVVVTHGITMRLILMQVLALNLVNLLFFFFDKLYSVLN